MTTTAIVPVKALSSAKGRLAVAFAPAQRQKVVAWMLDRVLIACTSAVGIDNVLVVAGDEEAAGLVGGRGGVDVLIVPRAGLTPALAAADAATADAHTTVVVAADLPQVTAADVDALIGSAGAAHRAVVVARTHDGGTGALLRRPPTIITTAFGRGSAALHMSLARGAGVRPVQIVRPGFMNDVDAPEDLQRLDLRALGGESFGG